MLDQTTKPDVLYQHRVIPKLRNPTSMDVPAAFLTGNWTQSDFTHIATKATL